MGSASSSPVPHLDRLTRLTERAQDRRSSLWPKTAKNHPDGGWKCPFSLACPGGRDHSAADLFCSKCGSKKPEKPRGWKCPSSRACPGGRDHTPADLFCCKCGSKKPAQGGKSKSKKPGSKKSRSRTSKKPPTSQLSSVQEEFYDDTPLVMHSNDCMPGAFRRYSNGSSEPPATARSRVSKRSKCSKPRSRKPNGNWTATSNECVPGAFQRRPDRYPTPCQDQRYGRPPGGMPSMDRYPSHLSD